MSERERWIVYPLLFLTLGIAMRNQFLPTKRFGAMDLGAGVIQAEKIICNNLAVLRQEECNRLHSDAIEFDEASGKHLRTQGLIESLQLKAIEADFRKVGVADAQGRPVILIGTDLQTQFGVIQITNSEGKPQVRICASEAGGVVAASQVITSGVHKLSQPESSGVPLPSANPPSQPNDSSEEEKGP